MECTYTASIDPYIDFLYIKEVILLPNAWRNRWWCFHFVTVGAPLVSWLDIGQLRFASSCQGSLQTWSTLYFMKSGTFSQPFTWSSHQNEYDWWAMQYLVNYRNFRSWHFTASLIARKLVNQICEHLSNSQPYIVIITVLSLPPFYSLIKLWSLEIRLWFRREKCSGCGCLIMFSSCLHVSWNIPLPARNRIRRLQPWIAQNIWWSERLII